MEKKKCPATTYFPTPFPGQYHRHRRTLLPGSECNRVFPLRHSHRANIAQLIKLHGIVIIVLLDLPGGKAK